MDNNETQEHISLLNIRLMRSIDTLVDAYDRGYEFFKEERTDGDVYSYYVTVLYGFAEGVVKRFKTGGPAAAATSEPIVLAVAMVKYLSEHPEFKSNLMF